MKLIAIPLAFLSIGVGAESFTVDGTIVESVNTIKTFECEGFQVSISEDKFPIKHEMSVPQKYRIKGFFGSYSIISKSAKLLPYNLSIPAPQDIKELSPLYPKGRTFLPTSAACKGSTLIISYWSGGNCKECEAFVKFEVENGFLKSAQKANYGDVRALGN